jgi:hypothetical protein
LHEYAKIPQMQQAPKDLEDPPFLYRGGLPVPPLFRGFTLYTHQGIGNRLKPVLGNTLAAFHTKTVFALLDPG